MLERHQAGYRFRFEGLRCLVAGREPAILADSLGEAGRRSAASGRGLLVELEALYLAARAQVAHALAEDGAISLWQAWSSAVGERGGRVADPAVFVCDASLGGLARWLRAAGYIADWKGGGSVLERVGRAQSEGAVLLTGDSRALDFGAIRDRRVLTLWLPATLGQLEQLALALGDLGLPAREARCMACGGQLTRVAKDSVRERIPPRTALWKDEYFVCGRCERLYWEGTHWERIARALKDVTERRSEA